MRKNTHFLQISSWNYVRLHKMSLLIQFFNFNRHYYAYDTTITYIHFCHSCSHVRPNLSVNRPKCRNYKKRQFLRIFGDLFCNFLKFLGISETMYVLIIDIIHYSNPIESNQIDKIHLDFSSSTGN